MRKLPLWLVPNSIGALIPRSLVLAGIGAIVFVLNLSGVINDTKGLWTVTLLGIIVLIIITLFLLTVIRIENEKRD